MTALIDTGFLYATLDRSDAHHERVTNALTNLTDDLLIPTVYSGYGWPCATRAISCTFSSGV